MALVFQIIIGAFAVILIVVGALAAFTPIPFGIPFIALGIILLSIVAAPVRKWLRRVRRRWKWLDRQLDRAQETLPGPLATPLRQSDPHEKNDDDDDEVDDGAEAGPAPSHDRQASSQEQRAQPIAKRPRRA